MTFKEIIGAAFLVASASQLSANAQTECYGSGQYQVCTSTTYDANGNISIKSWDTQGNTYSVNTDSYVSPDGDISIRSYDSEGNNYSVESWSDEYGVHSRDSEGNTCTITNDGEIIGCD